MFNKLSGLFSARREQSELFIKIKQDLSQMMLDQTGDGTLGPNIYLWYEKGFRVMAFGMNFKFNNWEQYRYVRPNIIKLIEGGK